MRLIVTDRVAWSVRWSVCHDRDPCKNGLTDRYAVWMLSRLDPRNPRIRWEYRVHEHRECVSSTHEHVYTAMFTARVHGRVQCTRPCTGRVHESLWNSWNLVQWRTLTLLSLHTIKILFLYNQDGRQPMPGHVRAGSIYSKRLSNVRCEADCRWVHAGATWRTRLNRPCAATMRPFVKLLWALVPYVYFIHAYGQL